MFDDVNFRHSLLAGSSWNMVLEVLVAVIDCLDSVSLPGIPPGHGYWDWRGYGVAEDWVVDHSALEFSVGRHLAWLAGWAGLDCTGCTDCHHCWGSCGAVEQPTGQETFPLSARVMQREPGSWLAKHHHKFTS